MTLPAWLAPNRIAAYLGGIAAVLAALVALLGEIDAPQAAALAVALGGFETTILGWLRGWQKHEERQDAPLVAAAEAVSVRAGIRPDLSEAEILEIAEAVAARLRDDIRPT